MTATQSLIAKVECEDFALNVINICARIYQGPVNKTPLPLSRKTILRYRTKLFADILNGEVGECVADAAQKFLSISAKALERKRATVGGLAIIKDEEAQEAALLRQGFRFKPELGDFVKALGHRREYWLCLFLDVNQQMTAVLKHRNKVVALKGELRRWSLLNLGEGLASVLKEAEQMVANLPIKAPA